MSFLTGRNETFRFSIWVILTQLMVVASCFMVHPVSALGEDRLVVKNLSGVSTSKVDHTGFVFSADLYAVQGANPGFWLDETGAGSKRAYFVLDSN